MENRAAVFTSQPQAVEVYRGGAWWAGELLGWRHDADGSCQVWVRAVLGDVVETAWTDLASLRLPDRHLAIAGQPGARGAHGPGTQEMSVARHPSGRRKPVLQADGQAQAGASKARDLSAVPDLPSSGGRRTADETAQFASVGRRRAPETAEKPAVGGRRTADETAQFASVGRRRAPERPPARPVPAAPAGRHRAADTGRLPGVGALVGAAPHVASGPVRGDLPAPRREARSPEPGSRTGGRGTAPEDPEPELLTRPMRLSDRAPHGRRPRLDGSDRPVV